MSQLKTDEDSLDWRRGRKVQDGKKDRSHFSSAPLQCSRLHRPPPPGAPTRRAHSAPQRQPRGCLQVEVPSHGLAAAAVPTGILGGGPRILKNHKKPPPSPTTFWTLFLLPTSLPTLKC